MRTQNKYDLEEEKRKSMKPYDRIVLGAQELNEKIRKRRGNYGFDSFSIWYASLREEYITEFGSMTREERQNASWVLHALEEHCQAKHDVMRSREMKRLLADPE